MGQAIICFLSMVVLEYIWAHYTIYLMQNKPALASLAAMGITVANAVVTIFYVDDHWLIVPTMLGAFVGTYAAIKWKPRWLH